MSLFSLFKKKTNCVAEVLFRGTLPPKASDFSNLAKCGVDVRDEGAPPTAHWALTLSHMQWGAGRLLALKDVPDFPRANIDYSYNLSPKMKETLGGCQSRVWFSMDARKNNVLHDRKQMFRFLRAIMGDDGQGAYDMQSLRIWTREELDDELCHDADLDVEALYVLHAVGSDSSDETRNGVREGWLHTHGLSELGAFDFDILNPSSDLLSIRGEDFIRSIAFGIVEGRYALGATTPFTVAGDKLRLETADDFMRKAKPEHRRLREMDDTSHQKNRAVACEPAGFFSSMFGGSLEPAKFFGREIPDGCAVRFSHEATQLMAQRARRTYSVFKSAAEEVREFDFPCIVKIGYAADSGGPNNHEHLWFQVHECRDGAVDATLLNQPFNIARMKEGDRGDHSVENLTDWMIMTPGGSITPRSLRMLRFTRENKPQLLRALREQAAL